MKASDYIVQYLIQKGITDVFGYPGGMVTHLMDSFYRTDNIKAHVCYHEQGAAFEACGYAQSSGKLGVAYATSGPGATNLITGICNAFFDSVPVLFITGQVNTFEAKGALKVRQRGFQETDIISMVQNVTNYAHYVTSTDDLMESLEKAYVSAMSGRKAPVLLDIPMNIQRAEIDDEKAKKMLHAQSEIPVKECSDIEQIVQKLNQAKRPVLLLGAGLKQNVNPHELEQFLEKTHLPVVTSMIAFDTASEYPYHYGFLGAYGTRSANWIVAKSDLLISLGARLDVRQVGGIRENFAPDAQIIRVDIDAEELAYPIRENDKNICADAVQVLRQLADCDIQQVSDEWLQVCDTIREKVSGIDDNTPNQIIAKISTMIQDGTVITTDVGQNQVWIAQSFQCKKNQKFLFSGGHGAMGYSLPAGIGAYFGTHQPVISFTGDGGFQMNLQELEFIRRENLPVTVVVFNNQSLGMIRHFQQMYFEERYMQTTPESGYTVPPLDKISNAYDLEYHCIHSTEELHEGLFHAERPTLIEIRLDEPTFVFPKLRFGTPNQDQEPLIDRNLYMELMAL
ncbi:MAG: thiamine pyrophosphate-binding protein [Oscillospiraceae bacterium]